MSRREQGERKDVCLAGDALHPLFRMARFATRDPGLRRNPPSPKACDSGAASRAVEVISRQARREAKGKGIAGAPLAASAPPCPAVLERAGLGAEATQGEMGVDFKRRAESRQMGRNQGERPGRACGRVSENAKTREQPAAGNRGRGPAAAGPKGKRAGRRLTAGEATAAGPADAGSGTSPDEMRHEKRGSSPLLMNGGRR